MTNQELRFEIDLYWGGAYAIHPLLNRIRFVYGVDTIQDAVCKHYMPKYDPANQVTTIHVDEPNKPYTGKTTQIKEGRMINRMFPMLSKQTVTHLIEWWNGYKIQSAIRITQNDEEMEAVIRAMVESKDGAQSCMTRGSEITTLYEKTKLNPYMCYKHALGWALAYTVDARGVITNRAVVNNHSMTYVRAYTTSTGIAVGHTFQHALELLGYRKAEDWIGHKVQLIDEPLEFTNRIEGIVSNPRLIAPYIDGNNNAVDVATGEIIKRVDNNSNTISAKISTVSAMKPIRCTNCGAYKHVDNDVAYTDDGTFCIHCAKYLGYVLYLDADNKPRFKLRTELVEIVSFVKGSYRFDYADKSTVCYSLYYGEFLDVRDSVWSYIHSSYVSQRYALYDLHYGYYHPAI